MPFIVCHLITHVPGSLYSVNFYPSSVLDLNAVKPLYNATP